MVPLEQSGSHEELLWIGYEDVSLQTKEFMQ